MTKKIEFVPIGVIHSPFKSLEDMPIQPVAAQGIQGEIEIFKLYHAGLHDLQGFSHIILLTYLHLSEGFTLQVVPFLDDRPRGLFATRAPRRPNPIGLSIVRLEKIDQGILTIHNVDILDGTPLLDIKPYVPAFDHQPDARTGWLEKSNKEVQLARSDDRFSNENAGS